MGAEGSVCGSRAAANNVDVQDLIIVGGGPGGAYCAYKVHKLDPSKKVVLFEKSDHLGGRLMSKGHKSKVREELGGMRIFPSVMKNLVDLIKECNLNLVPVPLTDAHNLFHYKGQRYEKGNFTLCGRKPGQMADDCLAKYYKEFPQDAKKDPYECVELRKQSLKQFFMKYGATEEEFDAWTVYSGYDLYPDNVAASIFVKDGQLYGASLSKEQKYVHEGFQELVKRMGAKSSAKLMMQTKVLSIGVCKEQGCHQVLAADSRGNSKIWYAKNVLVSLPFDQMTELVDSMGISNGRKEALQNVQMLPLFKCFLQWEMKNVWWKDLGYACGKTTTELPVRQCHYYDENDILCYNSGPNAIYWKHEFETDKDAAARKMFNMLKVIHAMPDMPEPDWSQTLFKFWVDGSHKWKVNADIYDSMKTICHGKADSSKIYLAGDAFSGYQGWVVGALQTVDVCFEELSKTLGVPAPTPRGSK